MTCPSFDPAVVRNALSMLKALSHPHRLRMVQCLHAKRELTVGDLMRCISAEQAIVSKHLAILKRRGIVRSKVRGNCRLYSISNPNVVKILQCIDSSRRKACAA